MDRRKTLPWIRYLDSLFRFVIEARAFITRRIAAADLNAQDGAHRRRIQTMRERV